MSTVDKQQFRNNTGGFLGAVAINHKGEETGVAVEPDGTVWLSKAEQILTANAPRRPEDNPFVERVLKFIDPATGETTDVAVTPLTLVENGDRYVPSQDRPVPGDLSAAQATAEAQVAATGDEPQTLVPAQPSAATREVEVTEADGRTRPNQPVAPGLIGTVAQPGTATPPVPPRAAAAAAAAQEPTVAPTAPSDPLTTAEGENGQIPVSTPPTAPEPPQTTPEEAPVLDEETAAAVDPAIGEETGAAATPTGPATEGEYQAGEEVGTPTAPSTQPAPYTPPSE